MSDFSRKDEPDQNREIRSAGQTDEIEDGLEWIEETEETPGTFRSEVEITEDAETEAPGEAELNGTEKAGLPEPA